MEWGCAFFRQAAPAMLSSYCLFAQALRQRFVITCTILCHENFLMLVRGDMLKLRWLCHVTNFINITRRLRRQAGFRLMVDLLNKNGLRRIEDPVAVSGVAEVSVKE